MSSMPSAYKIMWIQVMFDLPTSDKKLAREAQKFRELLLNHGFEMVQYSVYLRSCGDKQSVLRYKNVIRQNLPTYGRVSVLTFTDKQFELMENFYKKQEEDLDISHYQLELL